MFLSNFIRILKIISSTFYCFWQMLEMTEKHTDGQALEIVFKTY